MKKFYKIKLPMFTLILELILIGALFMPLILALKDGGGLLSSLLDNSSVDNVITGWLVIPAMLGDLCSVMAYSVSIIFAIMYMVMVTLAIGWSILLNNLNKKENGWLMILAVMPAILDSLVIIIILVLVSIDVGSIALLIFTTPAVILLGAMILEIRIFLLQKGK